MPDRARFALITLGLIGLSAAHAQAPSDTARGMLGAWEISNAARDKTCPVVFKLDPAPAGFKLEFDQACGIAFPALKDVVAWGIGPSDAVRLYDAKGAIILDFMEVEAHMYEAERKGEGLFFMRTQAAARAATITPEQVFGDWTLLKEMEKPLCKLTLSNTAVDGASYKLTVKPGCDASVAGLGLSSWRLDSNELVLSGQRGAWRFSESDASTWERIPPSADPIVLMRQ